MLTIAVQHTSAEAGEVPSSLWCGEAHILCTSHLSALGRVQMVRGTFAPVVTLIRCTFNNLYGSHRKELQ